MRHHSARYFLLPRHRPRRLCYANWVTIRAILDELIAHGVARHGQAYRGLELLMAFWATEYYRVQHSMIGVLGGPRQHRRVPVHGAQVDGAGVARVALPGLGLGLGLGLGRRATAG